MDHEIEEKEISGRRNNPNRDEKQEGYAVVEWQGSYRGRDRGTAHGEK